MVEQVRYQYDKIYDTCGQAEQIAEYFHEILRGNPDYIDNRILLHWNNNHVFLCEFTDSNTHIHVSNDEFMIGENDTLIPVLEFWDSVD